MLIGRFSTRGFMGVGRTGDHGFGGQKKSHTDSPNSNAGETAGIWFLKKAQDRTRTALENLVWY